MSEQEAAWPAQWILTRLRDAYGASQWWPADSPLEVLVGAVLTQSVRWQNVRTAIARLKARAPMTESALMALPWADLTACLKPTRFPNQKARRLLGLLEMVTDHGRRTLAQFFATAQIDHRRTLLAVNGVGEETADAILLYAGQRVAFPVDAYTRRIAARVLGKGVTDHDLRTQTLAQLPEVEALADLHGLLVIHAQRHCLSRPRCVDCPLADRCRGRQQEATA